MYPGFQFASKSKKWQPRLRTSEESMSLCVTRLHSMHEKGTLHMRKKPDVTLIEQMSERAAVVWAIGKEVQMTVPLPDEALYEHWWGAWADGSDHIDTEIQSALIEKSDAFIPGHILTLKRLMDEHSSKAPVQPTDKQVEGIAVDEFNLLLKRLDYDVIVFQNWQKKCQNVHMAREHAKQEHRLRIRKQSDDNAQAFLDQNTLMTTWDGNKPEKIIAEIMNFKRDHISTKQGLGMHKIVSIVALNWAAPCLIPAKHQDGQINVLSWVLNDNMQSIALVVYPVYSYQKGRLYLEEQKATSVLAKGTHNVDIQFAILFSDQTDQRDARPMVYPGRLVFSLPLLYRTCFFLF